MAKKRAARTARVAVAIDRDSRFKVIALDEQVPSRYGKTDRDIVYRHRATGIRGRIEVKDVTPRSQYSDRERMQRQIQLMAAEQRRTGQPQTLLNRRQVHS